MDDKLTTSSISAILDFIVTQCNRNPYIEVCGFVGYDPKLKQYVVQLEDNTAADPKNFFIISPARYLKFKHEQSLIAIFHSHIVGDEQASPFDIKMSEACCVPFLIYSINSKDFLFYEPQNKEYDVKLSDRLKDKLK